MDNLTLIVLFENKKDVGNDILECFVNLFNKIGISEKFLDISRPSSKKTIREIAGEIKMKNKKSYQIESVDKKIDIDFIYGGNLDCMLMGLGSKIENVNNNLDGLIFNLMKIDTFLQANIYNVQYSCAQNEIFYDNLERYGLKTQNLKVYIDKDMNMKMVDISKNPGRRADHKGYIELVTSPMYIGDKFIEYTGADIDNVKQLEWAKVDVVHEGIYRIESWPHPFDSDEGEQRMRQETLRKLLFPKLYP
ncbi:MAG: hypothetical protein JW915_06850 [Chitinispirillaceae bacterium]|nr:hypothetical protein [Chitinispirillaceae bacterium]